MAAPHFLILGGTGEARGLAERLVRHGGARITLSLAGRTAKPLPQAGTVRVGGFGGAEGLAAFLRDEGVTVLADVTHPFAQRISANAEAAAARTGTPLVVLRRPEWVPQLGDRWISVRSAVEAAALLGAAPRRVLLAIGRNEIDAFRNLPHRFVVRSVDPVERPENGFGDAVFLLERGPFEVSGERALLREHAIDIVVAKNSGGDATYGKIAAARELGLPVLMIERPRGAGPNDTACVEEAFARLLHAAGLPADRGE